AGIVTDQPHFRFYPDAYGEDGAFKASNELCDVCERPAVWLYTGEIYVAGEPPSVCARCMASGALAARLGRDAFALQDIVIDGADEELANEVLFATPGVASINAFEWPVVEGEPLVYVGAGDKAALKHNTRAQRAIIAAFAEIGGETGHPSHALV